MFCRYLFCDGLDAGLFSIRPYLSNVFCSSLIIGEHDLKTDSGHEQRFTFAEMILHPKYNPTNHDFDLALIRLNKKTSNSDRVKAACLPDHNTTFPIGTKCYITGWGLLSEYGRGPQVRNSQT